MKKIAFIVNPISGTAQKESAIDYLKEVFSDETLYTTSFHTTRFSGDAYLAAREFHEQKYDIVVAMGGDGTVNQVAKGLINSDTKLGIIPFGSGNGLARHLKIPLNFTSAIDTISREKVQLIDAGKINDETFFCTAGLGFEAVIGDRFNSGGSRGLITYMEHCAKEYVRYKSEDYIINIQGNQYKTKAFLITFANCAQWGNNVYIAPDANISDGMIDMVVWKKLSFVSLPILTAKLLLRTIQFSQFIDTYKCNNVTILREHEGLIKFDGESRVMGKEINVSILNQAVKVIVP